MAATEKGDVYVVWDDRHNIYFTSTHNNQTKFTPTAVLGEDKKLASSPQLAATESGDVYVVWVEKNNVTGNSNIEFISSNDSGKTFSGKKEISGANNTIPFSPQIAATEKGDVYVVWLDISNKTGDSNVELISSNDSGKTFSSQKDLRKGMSKSFSPQIAATENGGVYVVWVEKNNKTGQSNVELISSNNSGMSFDDTKKLTSGKPLSFSPQLAVTENGDVYVAWVNKNNKTGDTDILFRSSNDSGTSFDDRKNLRRSESLLSFSPQITATEKGDVYLVWTDKNSTTGRSDITFRSSNDRGLDFKRAVRLNAGEDKISNSSSPHIATTQEGSVYVIWLENQIQFKEILDKDAIFSIPISLSNKTTSAVSAEITGTKTGDLILVWVDKNNSTDRSLHIKRISGHYFDRNS